MSVPPLSVPSIPDPLPRHVPYIQIPDIRLNLWAYRLLRSFQINRTSGQLVHIPYYRPFSSIIPSYAQPPFLLAGDHYFEWRSRHHSYPICTVLFSVNPAFQFASPQVINGTHFYYKCPDLHILYWDLPFSIPSLIVDLLQELED